MVHRHNVLHCGETIDAGTQVRADAGVRCSVPVFPLTDEQRSAGQHRRYRGSSRRWCPCAGALSNERPYRDPRWRTFIICCTCSGPEVAHSGGSIGKPNVRSWRKKPTYRDVRIHGEYWRVSGLSAGAFCTAALDVPMRASPENPMIGTRH